MTQNLSSSKTDNYGVPGGSGGGVTTSLGFTNPQQSVKSANDASGARLAAAGLTFGAVSAFANQRGLTLNSKIQSASANVFKPEQDWRVRVSLQPSLASKFYDDPTNPILSRLKETSGVIFPYTPQINVTHVARYNNQSLTHSNYASYFYESSEVQTIAITADFTVQNIEEGQYLMAVIHFFRTVTKMFYGANSTFAGAPPPLVFLNGYGSYYFPNVSCVVTQFQHTMPSDSDYIEVPIGVNLNNYAANAVNLNSQPIVRLPTISSISVYLQPVYSRNNIARNFTLEGFAKGQQIAQIGRNGVYTGGFI